MLTEMNDEEMLIILAKISDSLEKIAQYCEHLQSAKAPADIEVPELVRKMAKPAAKP